MAKKRYHESEEEMKKRVALALERDRRLWKRIRRKQIRHSLVAAVLFAIAMVIGTFPYLERMVLLTVPSYPAIGFVCGAIIMWRKGSRFLSMFAFGAFYLVTTGFFFLLGRNLGIVTEEDLSRFALFPWLGGLVFSIAFGAFFGIAEELEEEVALELEDLDLEEKAEN